MRWIFIIMIFHLAFCDIATAQNSRIKRLRQANEYYEAKQYPEAIAEYEILMNSRSGSVLMGTDAKVQLADCYLAIGESDKAEPLYRENLIEYTNPVIYRSLAEALMLNGKIAEAKEQLYVYQDKRPDDPKGGELLARCAMIEDIVPIYSGVYVNVQTAVNKEGTNEFASSYCGEDRIIYSSDRIVKGSIAEWTEEKTSYFNVYIAEADSTGMLSEPKRFPFPINSPSRHDGPVALSRDGKTMYFSQSVKGSAASGELKLQIVVSTYENDMWSSPQPLDFVQTNSNYTHPSLSSDGLTMYFASDKPGGYGGYDIWYSKLRNGKWSAPENMGAEANTEQNEAYPYMHINGQFYFSSRGHANYGGYDLFRIRPMGDGVSWTAAENLGKPFNSHRDDTYFLLSDDETSGFFSSKRDGDDNIYHFLMTEAEAIPLPSTLTTRTAPDFLDLEEVVEENPEEGDITIDDWIPPHSDNNDVIDPDSIDADGGTPVINQPGENIVGDNDIIDNDWNPDNPSNLNDPPNNEWENNDSHENNDHIADHNSTSDKGHQETDINDFTEHVNTPFPDDDRPKEDNPQLTVVLRVVDYDINSALNTASVKVESVYPEGGVKEYDVQADGTVTLMLVPDAKYTVMATCEGYYDGELPIATSGAYYTQTLEAYLPLVKKDN